ncbi:hypothetical protein B9C88_21695 [Brevibacillus laterosporus]|uniref:helix-turn-helix domain-containing protein n=1 Tax=Brevibacillus laterosporus TaxID=1465 RepID=UPI000BD5269E|nr:helix-turn-helix transcriptional regulator [Brevibacillus laterosporus]PCN42314.1 hypothetical protein B9C88_21695 [Brevibacillus laterosporus]
MSSLGSRLKQARENKRLTQIHVAKKLGISNGTLSGYERNYRDPDTETLSQLAGIYEVSLDWLVGKTSSSTKEFTSDTEQIQNILDSLPSDKRKYFLEQISIIAAGIRAMEKERKDNK